MAKAKVIDQMDIRILRNAEENAERAPKVLKGKQRALKEAKAALKKAQRDLAKAEKDALVAKAAALKAAANMKRLTNKYAGYVFDFSKGRWIDPNTVPKAAFMAYLASCRPPA